MHSTLEIAGYFIALWKHEAARDLMSRYGADYISTDQLKAWIKDYFPVDQSERYLGDRYIGQLIKKS